MEEFRPEERPSIVVLYDDSKSMDTRDVVQSTESVSGSSLSTRREAIARMIDPNSWSALRERMNVTVQAFATPEPGSRTDLYEPLAEAPEKFKNLLGVVLISDGDWNQGLPPVQAATKLRLKGVPVFSVPVGSSTRLPDIDLQSLGAHLSPAGRSHPFTWKHHAARECLTTVRLKIDGDEISESQDCAMGRGRLML